MMCSVQCSMCSMKCTGAHRGAGAGASTVCSVHCAVCSVQCTVEILEFKKDDTKIQFYPKDLIIKNQ